MTYCGIILNGEEGEDCAVAFITDDDDDRDEDVATYSTHRDEDIIDLITEYRPDVIALNAPPEEIQDKELVSSPESDTDVDPDTAQQFRSGEEELVDEGYSLLPRDMRSRRLLERAEFLSNSIKRSGVGAQIIESHPKLVAQRLDITDDRHLEAYGIDTDDIESVWEFDAVLLAYTAKLYADDQCDGTDIVLPEERDL